MHFLPARTLLGIALAAAASAAHAESARFVRVEIPGIRGGINLAEVEVFGDNRNLARAGRVLAPPVRGGDPDVAINGDTSGPGEGFHFQRSQPNPWLEVDLGAARPVGKVVIWPRAGLAGRLDGAVVSLLDEERRVVWHRIMPQARQGAMEFSVVGPAGGQAGRRLPEGDHEWFDPRRVTRADEIWFPPAAVERERAPESIEVVALEPPPDADRRIALFAERDSAAGLADLCRRFQAALEPEAEGLDAFRDHCGRGEHRQALEAYRDFFFAKDSVGRLATLPDADATAARALLRHRPLRSIPSDPKRVLTGDIRAPGSAIWIPWNLEVPAGTFWARLGNAPFNDPFWETAAGRQASRLIEFFTEPVGLRYSLFEELLRYYAATGESEPLETWMDYLDDWYLFGRADLHGSPLGLVWHSEQGGAYVNINVRLLHSVAAARPAFKRELRPTTLVRFLLGLVEEQPPQTIRLKRTQLANHGTMSVSGILHLHAILPEFKAVQRYAREAWRLWGMEWIHRNAPDGTQAENVFGPYRNVALDRFPRDFQADWVSDLEWQEMYDKVRRVLRHNIGEAPPCGAGFLHRDNRAWTDEPADAVFQDPEMAARLALFRGDPAARPGVLSELMPYGAKYVLRESWQPQGLLFLLNSIASSSQDPLLRGEYSLSWGTTDLAGKPLPASGKGIHFFAGPLYGYPLLVDGLPPNPMHAAVYPVGGKTDVLAQAARQTVDTRFHTSPRFDLIEVRQDAPYAAYRHWSGMPGPPQNQFVRGPHAETAAALARGPIRDVTAWRQVLAVRGERIYVVADRVETTAEHDYTRPLFLGLGLPQPELDRLAAAGRPPVELDLERRRVRTALPEIRNLALHFFGPPDLAVFNQHDREGKPTRITGFPAAYPLAVGWRGRGNQALVAVHHAREADEPELRAIEPLAGPAGTAGFEALTDTAARVWFQIGPESATPLAAGPARVRAESVLIVARGEELSGVVLGCRSDLAVGDRLFPAPAESFEFVLAADGRLTSTAIHRPIDRVRILPETNVFTDSTAVSFEIPGQPRDQIAFHYTLDGSDPTLDSPRFREPVRLAETTLVKVRAFRAGLTRTPYRQHDTSSSETFHALFTRRPVAAAVEPAGPLGPGLDYELFEDPSWPRLFAHAGEEGVLDGAGRGTVASLLDPDDVRRIRRTDGPYAIVSRGLIRLPAGGVYGFHAPPHLYDVTADAGYDLRVFVDGQEWRPTPRLHAEHTWYLPLAEGLHSFEVRFIDFRHTTWRNLWYMIGHPDVVWEGIPVLEISGPELPRQPLPARLLWRPTDRLPAPADAPR